MELTNDSVQLEDIKRLQQLEKDISVPGVFKFTTKDSGQREDFPTGARRDTQDGKPRFDLIPVCSLRRLADLYASGAVKYGEGNYERGMPFKRVYASLLRHVYAWAEGDRTEDHAAAIAWNAFALMLYEERINQGRLPAELDDMGIFISLTAPPGVETITINPIPVEKEGPAD